MSKLAYYEQPIASPAPTAKILIVDDDPISRLMMADAVAELGHIVEAETGSEALKILQEFSPEVILLDIQLPDMLGYEVAREIKSQGKNSQSRIIFVTSNAPGRSEELALDSGGIDFIEKPIHQRVCALRVRNQLLSVQQERRILTQAKDLTAILERLPVHVSYWNEDWRQQYSNEDGFPYVKVKAYTGCCVEEFFEASLAATIQQCAISAEDERLKRRVVDIDCEPPMSVQLQVSSRIDDQGERGYLLTLHDITELRRAHQATADEKERFFTALRSIGDAVICTDDQGLITFMNAVAEHMTGWSWHEAKLQAIETVMQLHDALTRQPSINPVRLALSEQRTVGMALNCQLTGRHRQVFRVEDSAAPIRDSRGNITGAIIVFHDVSEAIAMAVKMNHLAYHDQLTNLPNRILLLDRLEQGMQVSMANRQKLAMLIIDIDHFKYINDSHGHDAGDTLIVQLAKRLESVIPQGATLARVGGDEFIVVLPNLKNDNDIDNVCLRINVLMKKPFDATLQANLSVSVGVSIFPDDASSQEELMRHADVAMYRAKYEGRNRFCYFSPALEERLIARRTIEQRLRWALVHDSLDVYYQPKLNIRTGELIGAEALCRLIGEDGAHISPLEFIPIAEETGLINELGQQVLWKSCKQLNAWLKAGHNLSLAVNTTVAQLEDSSFIHHVEKMLTHYQLPPESLQIEVTESALIDNGEAVESVFKSLKKLGLSIAIDDFGTGYSNLAYLKRYSVDVLKIDQSFVKDMHQNQSDHDIVYAIVGLARSLGLTLVAEGVETPQQKDMLAKMGCEIAQGFLFDRPIPAKIFQERWLQKSTCYTHSQP